MIRQEGIYMRLTTNGHHVVDHGRSTALSKGVYDIPRRPQDIPVYTICEGDILRRAHQCGIILILGDKPKPLIRERSPDRKSSTLVPSIKVSSQCFH